MYRIIDDWKKTNKHLNIFDEVIYRARAPFAVEDTSHIDQINTPTFDKKGFMHGVAGRQENNNGIVNVESPYFIPMMQFVYEFCDDMGINMIHLGRACINMLLPATHDRETNACEFHVDHHYPHYSIIFYLSDTDGDTLISDQKYNPMTPPDYYDFSLDRCVRVSPKRGRILLFDGLYYHTGSYPTKEPRTMFVATPIASNIIF